MIIGIGCDIVDHNLTKSLGWSSNPPSLGRIFSRKEIELIQANNNDRFISGRYAVKEAVLKCFGTGMKDGIDLTDISTSQDKSGKPTVQIVGEVKRIADQLGITSWHITISHTNNCSLAFVIAEG